MAQPKFAALAKQHLASDPENAIASLTYALLEGETGNCSLPPELTVQVDNPAGEDFWPGEPTMLYLAQHIAQAVAGGIARVLEDPNSTPTLALPPGVLEPGPSQGPPPQGPAPGE